MKNAYLASSLAAAVALTLAMQTTPARAASDDMEKMMMDAEAAMAAGTIEKCYGVALAGMNDCQTATSSCAGSSTTDDDQAAFVIVPSGTCSKLTGGSTEPM